MSTEQRDATRAQQQRRRADRATIAWFCLAQVCVQLGAFTFPALLPALFVEWQLTHSQAGWLSGILFGAYAAAVPILLPLTDRIDARKVYIIAACTTALAHFGTAFLATDFATAFFFRVITGIGWAGTYMVGLKALTDRINSESQPRAVSMHAASIGMSGASSFVIAGVMSEQLSWHAAFIVGGFGALVAVIVALTAIRAEPARDPASIATARLFDFGPVLRNRAAMSYSLGYCVHTWEMFVVRSWAVTFLVFAGGPEQRR